MKKKIINETDPVFYVKEIKRAQAIYRALDHKQRIQILRILIANPRINVTALYKKMKVTQSTVSQHLAILRMADIVYFERNKQTVNYFVDHAMVQKIIKASQNLLKL